MPDFDKDLFMDKVKKYGFEIKECGDNTFELPNFSGGLSKLSVYCGYKSDDDIIYIKTSMPIAENVINQVCTFLCDRMNITAKFHTKIQKNVIASNIESELFGNVYSDNDALDYAADFILTFKQDFERYGFETYYYANTGSIKFLLNS